MNAFLLRSLRHQSIDRIPLVYRRHAMEWTAFVPYYDWGERLGSFEVLELGTRESVWCDFRCLHGKLTQLDTHAFFLFHNHPSQMPRASEEDLQLTCELMALCHQLNLLFLGHAVITHTQVHWIC